MGSRIEPTNKLIDCQEGFKIRIKQKKHQNCKKMKMPSDLDQWLIRPMSTSKQSTADPLAAFRKMTISLPEPKFCLPSILTSGNNSTWLATRKNDNDMSRSTEKISANKTDQDDNSKWLLKPKNKTETDLVTLTEDPNPWLAPTSSVMTTSLDSLPGSFTLPSNFSSELSKDIWLSKPATAKQTSPNLSKDLDGWLLVAPPISSAAEEPAASTSAKTCTNPLDEWERQSLTCNWIINDNNTTTLHIEEWLKKALEDEEDDETDDISDDFDDCSIEVISQN